MNSQEEVELQSRVGESNSSGALSDATSKYQFLNINFYVCLHREVGDRRPCSPTNTGLNSSRNRLESTNYSWWLRVTIYSLFLLAGQSAATLLGRLYYDKGGNSKWMATFVQSAGFPVLLPLLFFFPSSTKLTTNPVDNTSTSSASKLPKLSTMVFLYVAFGLLLIGDNMMYSYGLLFLPVSTYSLLCATQLAFNAIFSFFLNSQKFTPLILNSLVLVTMSASILAINADSENTNNHISKRKYVIGFLCTLGASATYSLYLSLVQLSFQKVIKRETFSTILNMQIYPSFVATCGCVVGLFASGEWNVLESEMKEYKQGRVSYVMTLLWIAVTWQICSVGLLGLIFEVSSLFSNVISTLGLPLVPILAAIFFHDKMEGMKVMAMLLAIWGFLSYIYQHYQDDLKSKAKRTSQGNQISGIAREIC